MNHQDADTADPRVDLARHRTRVADLRTKLALDRTTLAWIRTAIAMATFGFGAIGFYRTLEEKFPSAKSAQLHQGAIRLGITLVVMGIAATLLAGASQWLSLRKLRRGEEVAITQWPLSLTLAMLLAVLGVAALWYATQP